MTDRYCSPTGAGSRNGSRGNEYALSDWMLAPAGNASNLQPGDITWMLGGTYKENFNSQYNYYCVNSVGTLANPVKLIAYPGARPIIDMNNNGGGDVAGGGIAFDNAAQNMIIQDLEITDSSGSATINHLRSAFFSNSPLANNIHIVNCIIHDTGGMAFGLFDFFSSELYGNVCYYTGATETPGQRGYVTYLSQTNNPALPNILRDNIFFHTSNYACISYVTNSPGRIANYNYEGNTIFQAGLLDGSGTKQGSELLVGTASLGTAKTGTNNRIDSNYLYCTDIVDTGFNLGYDTPSVEGSLVTNNYMVCACRWVESSWRGLTMNGNTFIGNMYEQLNGVVTQHFPTQAQWPGNTITDTSTIPSSGKVIFRRANRYEGGRMNVTIYNYDLSANVAVDISVDDKGNKGVKVGDSFAIYWAPNFASKTPCVTGVYGGGTVNIPIGSLGVMPTPNCWSTPASVAPQFGAFIVQTTLRH